MAYKIIASSCTTCAACEPECPNDAIYENKGLFAINNERCSECVGYFDEPQCIEQCPSEGTIVIDKSVPRYQRAA